MLIPEAVRGLGGAPGVYALNSRFRRNLSTRFYADGGVNPDGTPILPGLPPGPESELDVLKQIRDLLAGKGGTSAPLNATATNTASMSTAVSNAADAGQEIGPFGTPLKKKNRAYDAAKGALEALGFDAETIIGSDPTTYKPQTSFASGAPGAAGGTALPGAGVDFAAIAASLSKFALSGNLADVAGLGLNANSPVITAITSARNKKKGGLDDQAISDLVTQVVTGGYTGVLDEQNSSLIKSLQSFRDSSMKKGAIPGTAPGTPVGGVAMGTDQGSIARAIYAAVTSQGYSPAVGQAAVQAALLESGLSTSAMNAGHNSLFQTSADKGVGSDPASQIQWLLGEMARQGGPAAANADPLNFFADRIERGGYPGSNYNQFAAQAQALLGSGQIPTATTYPLATPGGTTVTGQQGLQPAAQNLLQVIESTFPQIKNIGGVRPDSLPYHPSGRALDIMIPGAAGGNDPTPPDAKVLGDQIYSFLMANASQLGIDTSGTLWQQKDHYNHIHAQLLDGVQQFTNAGLASPGMTGGLGGSSAQYGGATPVYVVNMGGGGLSPLAKPLLDGLASGGSEAAQNVIGDLGGAMTGAFTTPDGQRRPDATLGDLVGEQNPMALAAALGFHVEDFTREGGIGAPNIQQAGGFDATGRLFSDTAGLMDRTMTSLNAQLMAMRDQIVDVITQMSDKLNKEALEPTLKAGVQNALEGLKDSVTQSIGQGLGTAAAPPIADAVSSAVAQLPVNSSGAASTGGTLGSQMAAPASTIAGGLFASGGAIWGGIPGKDSVPILAQQGEFVLDKGDVSRMGGISGVEHFRRALEKRGGIRHMATGGGVNVNDVVGAEFFGVSEVPIIGTIVNLLIRVLLKMIGVDIEARDTMVEMSDDFRSFRGDAFKAFDAQGRLLNDTSGLIERSSTSTETAAAERIRILKIVIQAIIKYLIEKVIVPIAKAVANSLIQAGASAAGASIAGAGGGPAGGIVSSVISSAGSAGVDIAAEVGTDFALAMSETIINMVGEGLMSQFGDQMTAVFGGGILANLFDPAGGFMGALIGGIMAIFAGLLGGTFGGAATMIPGDALFGGLTGGSLFDDGGMAEGQGFLPKASMGDELVLSPVETDLFSRFVSALERGGFGSGGSKTVNAPITVIGGRETANQVQDRLLKLMP
ncbi:MAG: hypothetical protein JO214_00715 [Frankiaceae bacterium]|nr:hypothetical protein [Frankiaceae bacterium]